MNLGKLQETVGTGKPGCCSLWGCRVGLDLVTEQQQQQNEKEERTDPSLRLSHPVLVLTLKFTL